MDRPVSFMYKCVMDRILETLRTRLLAAHCRDLLPEDWSGDYPGDPFHRIYLVEAGAPRISHHGTIWRPRVGDGLLIPAHADHILACDKPCTIRYIHCEAMVLGGVSLFDYARPLCHIRPGTPRRMRQIMVRLQTSLRRLGTETPLAGQLLEMAGLQELLSLFLRNTKNGVVGGKRWRLLWRLRPVLENIEQHLAQHLRVADLARLAHLDRGYFCRLFHEAVGLAPSQYIQRRRVERSRQLLLGGGQTLEEIALATGFYDAYHFSRIFKRLTGVPPGVYRRLSSTGKP